ncbi:hypothetical protein JXA85_06300 [Candidatus Woesearchaeota archaeon]|nr:hypothetical protein [Candidatus Woesearchaeota archaeon]
MASGYYNLENFIRSLENLGVSDVLLPFLLIFTVLFAILQKARIFGEGKKNINLAVAVIIAAMVVVPHVMHYYPNPAYDPVNIMNNALPQVSVVIVAIVMLLILIGLFGGEVHLIGMALSGWVTFISIAIIVLIFGGSAGWWNFAWFYQFFGTEAVSLIIILLVFGLLVMFIAGGDKEKKSPSKFWENLQNAFTGGGKK